MISTVVFDADETLIDLRPAVRGALTAVLDELRALTQAAAGLTVEDLAADWKIVFSGMAAAPVAEIRRAALARTLSRLDLGHELDRLADLYFARRFALTTPFPDAVTTLSALAASYQLGFATNGNSRADRCGLDGHFAFQLYAHVDGLPKKPSGGFYTAVVRAAGVCPGQVVYVGDNVEHDVVPAQAAGLRAVWVNRAGAARPSGVTPDAEIRRLADLPAALATLTSAPSCS